MKQTCAVCTSLSFAIAAVHGDTSLSSINQFCHQSILQHIPIGSPAYSNRISPFDTPVNANTPEPEIYYLTQ